MKKICFIAWERFSFGGISRVISDIINGLSDEYEITILCLKDKEFLENIYQIDFAKVKIEHLELNLIQKVRREVVDRCVNTKFGTSSFFINNYAKLKYSKDYRKKIISFIGDNFDLVIGASGLQESFLLSSIANEIGGYKIGWMHTSYEGYFLQRKREMVDSYLLMTKMHLNRLNHLLVLSKTDSEKYKGLANNTSYIYNPVSFDRCNQIIKGNKRFLYVGALSHVKGADILIDAFEQFAKQEENWSLDIYGDGPLWGYIENKIKTCNLTKRVSLNHSVKDVQSLYKKAGCLIFPSRLEGFGIVQAEAMSCSLPIIANRLPITEELVEKTSTGIIFENSDFMDLSRKMFSFTTINTENFQHKALDFSGNFSRDRILSQWKMLVDQYVR